jgi:ribosomal protein L1
MKKRSRRYIKVKEKISPVKFYTLTDAFGLIKQNNEESSKKIKVSFNLNSDKQKFSVSSNGKLVLPFPVKKEERIALVKDSLDESEISYFAQKGVQLVSVDELKLMLSKKKKKN